MRSLFGGFQTKEFYSSKERIKVIKVLRTRTKLRQMKPQKDAGTLDSFSNNSANELIIRKFSIYENTKVRYKTGVNQTDFINEVRYGDRDEIYCVKKERKLQLLMLMLSCQEQPKKKKSIESCKLIVQHSKSIMLHNLTSSAKSFIETVSLHATAI
jgi:hypothetical protein